MKPDYWESAIAELAAKDPILKKVIDRYQGEIMSSRGNAFETLARSIVGQQISVKAAQSVWSKVTKLCRKKVTPQKIKKLRGPQLRACGLSRQKVSYLKDLSKHFLSKKIQPHAWSHLSDEDIIQELVAVKGIGRWTAEMFLMFHLLRPNIFPVADIGLHKALSINYKLKYPLSKTNLKKFSTAYAPWASVAVWYLWRSLDPIPVEY